MAQPLALYPALRSWTRLGLDCLLLDSPERVGALRRPAVQTEAGEERQAAQPRFRAAARPAPRPEGQENPRFRRPSPPERRFSRPAVQPRVNEAPMPRPQTAQSAVAAQPHRLTPPPLSVAQGHILPPEQWPPAWQMLLKRRMPPRPLVCWTYAGLGSDLAGTPDPARRDLLARMIRGLAHPAGTHVFWPFELPGHETAASGASLFWSGEALLRPRALLIMGSDARDALGLPKIGPYCQKFEQGRLIIQLPRPQSLVEKQEAFGQAMAFLSGLLRFCNNVRR